MKKATGNNGRIKENFLSSMVEIFELPAEVILDLPLVTLIGDNRLKIENYLSVTEYSPYAERTECGMSGR